MTATSEIPIVSLGTYLYELPSSMYDIEVVNKCSSGNLKRVDMSIDSIHIFYSLSLSFVNKYHI